MKSICKMPSSYILSVLLLLIPSTLTTFTPKSSFFAAALSTNTNNNNPSRTKIKNAPLALSEELGCSPTLTALMEPFKKEKKKNNKQKMVYFDPLQLATDQNFGRYREAELKHGRVCMLVIVICLLKTSAQEPDFIGFLASGQTPHVLKLIQEWSGGDYAFFSWIQLVPLLQMLFVCGILETLLLVQASPQDMPGDYGLGYFGVRDKGQNERSLVSELENGRLAMLIILYWLVVELLPPSVTSMFQEFLPFSPSQNSAWDAFLAALGGANLMGEIGATGVVDDAITTAATSVMDQLL